MLCIIIVLVTVKRIQIYYHWITIKNNEWIYRFYAYYYTNVYKYNNTYIYITKYYKIDNQYAKDLVELNEGVPPINASVSADQKFSDIDSLIRSLSKGENLYNEADNENSQNTDPDQKKVTNAAQQDEGQAEGIYYRLQKWAIGNAAFDETVDSDFTVSVDTQDKKKGTGSNKFVIASNGSLVSAYVALSNLTLYLSATTWIFSATLFAFI